MVHNWHILACYHSDGFRKLTTRAPFTLTKFDKKFCIIFRLQQIFGRMTKIDDRFWVETENFIESSTIHKHFNPKDSKETIPLSQYTSINYKHSKASTIWKIPQTISNTIIIFNKKRWLFRYLPRCFWHKQWETKTKFNHRSKSKI